jgi:hypothetical protein
MRVPFTMALLLLVALTSPAETLKELLRANRIPAASFTETELAEDVQGEGSSNDLQIVFAFRQHNGDLLFGPLHLVHFDKTSGAIVRRDLKLKHEETCDGSLLGVSFLHDFTVLELHLTPSAACLVVLNKNFEVTQELYGFGWTEIAPYQVVIIEDMIHFAPVHPERLQVVDLHSGKVAELYPPQGDKQRAHLIAEHAKHLPQYQTCARMNDPCDPKLFDEMIESLATDGQGHFAFLASQFANHATMEEQPPVMVARQTIIYIYRQDKAGWHYCEQKVTGSDEKVLAKELKLHFDQVAMRCTPNLPVVPDMSTASFNPFLKH